MSTRTHHFEYRRAVAQEPISCVVYGEHDDPVHDEPMKFTITRDGEQLSAEHIVELLNNTSDPGRGPAILGITRRERRASPMAPVTHHIYRMSVLMGGMSLAFDVPLDLRAESWAADNGGLHDLLSHWLQVAMREEIKRMFDRDFDKAFQQMETRP